MKAWKTLETMQLLSYGRFLTVENHVVELPDGRQIADWPWLITPDFINVVVITTEGLFLCFQQVKYGLEGETLAVVGGFIEPGEEPLAAAQRELMEETGYKAGAWTFLGSYRIDPNRGAGTGHLFLARDAYSVGERSADDLEEQHLVQLTEAEMQAALAQGQFKAMAWTTNVALALLHLRGAG